LTHALVTLTLSAFACVKKELSLRGHRRRRRPRIALSRALAPIARALRSQPLAPDPLRSQAIGYCAETVRRCSLGISLLALVSRGTQNSPPSAPPARPTAPARR